MSEKTSKDLLKPSSHQRASKESVAEKRAEATLKNFDFGKVKEVLEHRSATHNKQIKVLKHLIPSLKDVVAFASNHPDLSELGFNANEAFPTRALNLFQLAVLDMDLKILQTSNEQSGVTRKIKVNRNYVSIFEGELLVLNNRSSIHLLEAPFEVDIKNISTRKSTANGYPIQDEYTDSFSIKLIEDEKELLEKFLKAAPGMLHSLSEEADKLAQNSDEALEQAEELKTLLKV